MVELIVFADEFGVECGKMKENIYDSNIFELSNWEDGVAIYREGRNEEAQIS